MRQPPARLLAMICFRIAVRARLLIRSPCRNAIVLAVLLLCLGHRYLPRWALPIGWVVVAAVVVAVGLDRVSVGAHWPSDVLAGMLIATSWLALVISIRWISDPALDPKPKVETPARVSLAS